MEVPEPIEINPGLGRRIDLMAVTQPITTRRRLWFASLLTAWTGIGAGFAAVAHNRASATILGIVAVLGIVQVAVWARAVRRVPETKRWLDGLAGPRAQ
jgi:hypothetical protein